jgi:hypothetical protein
VADTESCPVATKTLIRQHGRRYTPYMHRLMRGTKTKGYGVVCKYVARSGGYVGRGGVGSGCAAVCNEC